mgnify:CR=1 FL=1
MIIIEANIRKAGLDAALVHSNEADFASALRTYGELQQSRQRYSADAEALMDNARGIEEVSRQVVADESQSAIQSRTGRGESISTSAGCCWRTTSPSSSSATRGR